MFTVLTIYLLVFALIFVAFSCFKIAFIFITLAVAYFLLAGCGIIPGLLLKYLQASYSTPINSIDKKRVAIILLGCSTIRWPDRTLVKATFFSYSRIFEAVRLYHLCKINNCECKIIISGGDVHTPGKSEAEAYRDELVDIGIAAEDIVLEATSRNTYQNAKFVCTMLAKTPYDQVLLINSAALLKRAMLYFSYFGIKPLPCPADYVSAWVSFKPVGYNFFLTDYIINEYIGILRFHIYTMLGKNGR